jgi:hypothetical protein
MMDDVTKSVLDEVTQDDVNSIGSRVIRDGSKEGLSGQEQRILNDYNKEVDTDNAGYPGESRNPSSDTPSPMHDAYTQHRAGAYTDDAQLKELQKQMDDMGLSTAPDPAQQQQAKMQSQDREIINAQAQIQGSLETVKALGHGGLAAAENVYNSLIDAGTWLNTKAKDFGWTDQTIVTDKNEVHFADQLISPPQDVTGKLIAGAAQFMLPFAAWSKALSGIEAVGTGANLVKTAATGALADFSAWDPHMERLSNFIQDVPWLRNPVAHFLASDPKDSAATGRVKQALEGTGIGFIIHGLSVLRGVGAAKAVAKAAAEGAAEAPKVAAEAASAAEAGATKSSVPELVPSSPELQPPQATGQRGQGSGTQLEFKAADSGTMEIKPVEPTSIDRASQILQKTGNAEAPYKINLQYVEAPEDVQTMMTQMSNAYKGEIDVARRGVVSDKELQGLADVSGVTVQKLRSMRPGEMLNPEQFKAARDIQVASFADLEQKLYAAVGPQATPEAKAIFMDAYERSKMVQATVLGVQAEYGRGFRQLQLMAAGTDAAKARVIDEILRLSGGEGTVDDIASRMVKAIEGKSGVESAKVLSKIVQRSFSRRLLDAVMEVGQSGLQSHPGTWVANIIGNTVATVARPTSTAVQAFIGAIRRAPSEERIFAKELLAQGWATADALKDAFIEAGRSLGVVEREGGGRSIGAPKFFPDHNTELNGYRGAISSANFPELKPVGTMLDYTGMAVRGTGGAINGAMDEFFKSIHYKMSLYQSAYRGALDKGLAGEEFKAYVESAIKNPSEDVHWSGIDDAREYTFNKDVDGNFKGEVGLDKIDKFLSWFDPVGKLIIPFRSTGLNAVEFAIEHGPLAPVLSDVRESLAAGGAKRDAALAKISLGASAVVYGAMLYQKGEMTGGPIKNPKGARMIQEVGGVRPYSMKIGDSYYEMSRDNPLGYALGMGADLGLIYGDLIDSGRKSDFTDLLFGAGALAAKNMVPERLIPQLADIANASNGDETAMKKIGRVLMDRGPQNGFGAFQGLRKFVREEFDHTARVTSADPNDPHAGWSEAFNRVRNTLPGKSDDLEPVLNIWAEPVDVPAGFGPSSLAPIFKSFAKSTKSMDPVDREIIRLNLSGQHYSFEPRQGESDLTISKPDNSIKMTRGKVSIHVDLTPKEHNDLIRLSAGIGLPGARPLKDTLRDVIGRFTERQSDQVRRDIIKKVIRNYRVGDDGKGGATAYLINRLRPEIKERFEAALKEGVGVMTEPGGQE